MKVTTANGKLQVTLNQAEWKQMGAKMGWFKEAKEAFPGAAPQFGKKKKDGEEKEPEEKEEKEACSEGMPFGKKKKDGKEKEEETDDSDLPPFLRNKK